MKRLLGFMVVTALLAAASVAAAANTVNVTGDLARDGYLTIDIGWSVDTAKFKGQQKDEIRQKVFEQIWDATIPKLVKATKGQQVSFDKCNFQKLSETKRLVETRPDGSELFMVSSQVKFTAPRGEAAPAATKASSSKPDKETGYRFVHEARDW